MIERQLTRKELGKRYGVARNTIYAWVQLGVLPDADIHSGIQHRWSETRLATWERAHLAALAGQGVDIDQLPQFVETGPAPRRKKPAGPTRQGPATATQVFAAIARARRIVIGAMARNKPLTSRERTLMASNLKQAIAILSK